MYSLNFCLWVSSDQQVFGRWFGNRRNSLLNFASLKFMTKPYPIAGLTAQMSFDRAPVFWVEVVCRRVGKVVRCIRRWLLLLCNELNFTFSQLSATMLKSSSRLTFLKVFMRCTTLISITIAVIISPFIPAPVTHAAITIMFRSTVLWMRNWKIVSRNSNSALPIQWRFSPTVSCSRLPRLGWRLWVRIWSWRHWQFSPWRSCQAQSTCHLQ